MFFCQIICGICVEIEDTSVTKRGVLYSFETLQSIIAQRVTILKLVTSLRKKLPKNLEAPPIVLNFALPEGHSRGDSDGTHLSNS